MEDYTFQDVNGFGGFGASPDGLGLPPLGAPVETVQFEGPSPLRKAVTAAYVLSGIAGAAIGAYHGYKRNDSVGWAIGWSLLGSVFPFIVIPVAYAQGISKRKGSSR